MPQANRNKKLKEIIAKTSPLHEYWHSQQNKSDETKRLNLSMNDSPASILFRQEPYKWETLFQSIILEIHRGDQDSIKGLKMLIGMLSKEEQEIMFRKFSDNELFSEEVLQKLKESSYEKSQTKKNRIRFLRILFAIFTNPYQLELKNDKNHIYERTGSGLNALRKWLKLH